MFERVKTLLEEEEKVISDSRLNELITRAETVVLSDSNQTELNDALETVVVALAVIMVNREGTEGVASESYSGVSTTYLNELPEDLKLILNSNRRMAGWD